MRQEFSSELKNATYIDTDIIHYACQRHGCSWQRHKLSCGLVNGGVRCGCLDVTWVNGFVVEVVVAGTNVVWSKHTHAHRHPYSGIKKLHWPAIPKVHNDLASVYVQYLSHTDAHTHCHLVIASIPGSVMDLQRHLV